MLQVQNLKTLSLEELMQIDVTTVSRAAERRIDAPAAVSVITAEDIRRRASTRSPMRSGSPTASASRASTAGAGR
jgi:iron complex outermembrane receptor protein